MECGDLDTGTHSRKTALCAKSPARPFTSDCNRRSVATQNTYHHYGHMRWILLIVLLPLPVLAESWKGYAYVVDGDTISINQTRLRLTDMDAFESAQNCEKGGQEYACGFEAMLALINLIRDREVRCEGDRRDRYHRPLVRCLVGNVDLGRQMVRSGWALAEFGEEYREDEALARYTRAGAWAGTFDRPKEWRRGHTHIRR